MSSYSDLKNTHLKHLLVALGLVQGHKGMQVGKLRPADGDHLTGGIQLHGAAAQGNHGVCQGEVLVLQALQVAQHLMLTLVQVEDLVLQEWGATLEVSNTSVHLKHVQKVRVDMGRNQEWRATHDACNISSQLRHVQKVRVDMGWDQGWWAVLETCNNVYTWNTFKRSTSSEQTCVGTKPY